MKHPQTKTLTRLILAAALSTAFAAPTLFLAAPASAAPQAKERDAKEHDGKAARGPLGHIRKAVDDLNLTGETKAKVEALMTEAQAKLRTMRQENKDAQPEQRKEAMKTFMDKLKTDIKADLTPDQAKKFDAEVAKKPEGKGDHGHEGGDHGKV